MSYIYDVKAKLYDEYLLFKKQIISIVVPTIILIYIFGGVTRNLAYYLTNPTGRLNDIGYDIIPEFGNNFRFLSDVCMYIITGLGCTVLILPIFYKPNLQSISTVNMGLRIIHVLTIGQFLRSITYLSTAIPPSSEHCQIDSPNYNPPTTISQLFFTYPSGMNSSCGDQIFSGHILQDITFILHIFRNSNGVFLRNKKLTYGFCIISSILFILQVIFILGDRNHYSVDIIVGTYTTFGVWYIYNNIYPYDNGNRLITFDEKPLLDVHVIEV